MASTGVDKDPWIKDIFRNAVQDMGRRFWSGLIEKGYDRAASVSLDFLDTRVDELNRRMGTSKKLTSAEQSLLKSLRDVRRELGDELERQREEQTGHI